MLDLQLVKDKCLLVIKDPFLNLSIGLHILLLISIFIIIPHTVKIKKATDEIVVVLDSVQIASVTNLQFKDTNAGSNQKNAVKKFTTIIKNSNSDEKINSVEAPTNVAESKTTDEPAPTKVIKKPKTKPQTGVITKKNIVSKNLNEDDELASLLQSLDEKTTSGSVQNTGEKSGVIGKGKTDYNQNRKMGISVINSIRSQFIKCWNVPIGAMSIEEIIVIIYVELDESGKVISAQIKNRSQYAGNPFAEALAESALRAVYACSPIQNLPKDNFKNWQKMELSFSAKDML